MRYKIVPPVRDVAFLRETAAALPLVPGSVEDCCTRIRDRTDVASRDEAREYLTFCQALGLAAETDRGFHRVRDAPDDHALAAAFEASVLGAREVLEAMERVEEIDDADGTGGAAGIEATDGIDDAAAFEAVRPAVPRWERHQADDWEATWQERARRCCGWAVAFGLAERTEAGRYRRRK